MAGKCFGSLPVTSYQWLTLADVVLLTCAHQQLPVHCCLHSLSTIPRNISTQVAAVNYNVFIKFDHIGLG